jgi:vacuolar-type H+-ATPase subunit H
MIDRAVRSSAAGPGPLGGFLERFRRSGGVPASVGGETASELEPLLVVLDSLEQEVAELLAEAEAADVRRLHEAEEQAQSILTAARERTESERDDAQKAGQRVVGTEVAAILAEAHADVERMRKTSEQRLPGLLAEVMERVLEVGS